MLCRVSLGPPSVAGDTNDLAQNASTIFVAPPLPCISHLEELCFSAEISEDDRFTIEVTLWLWLLVLCLNCELFSAALAVGSLSQLGGGFLHGGSSG